MKNCSVFFGYSVRVLAAKLTEWLTSSNDSESKIVNGFGPDVQISPKALFSANDRPVHLDENDKKNSQLG